MSTSRTASVNDTPTPPAPILRYLDYLDDPRSLLDTAAIAAAEEALASGDMSKGDQLRTKLHLLKLRDADDSVLVEEFLAAAPDYFDACGVNPEDGKVVLAEMGVPADVVDRVRTPRRASGGKVTVGDVYGWIKGRRTAFTKPEAVDATGASQGTVNKAVKTAMTDKVIRDLGGNPKRYERT